MKQQKLLSLVYLFTMSWSFLQAQITPTCPFPEPPGAETCSQTCVYCNLDGYQGTNNGTPSGGNTVCGQIVLHNDQWFGFTAGSSSITIDVVSSNCQNGNGLQMAVFDQCSDPDALACNPGASGLGDQTISLTYAGYIEGKTYFLLIDGWTGDVCDYTIVISDGSVIAPVPEIPDSITGPNNPCANLAAIYEVPPVYGAGFYQWTAPPGSSINGQGNTVQVNAPGGNQVTVTFGNISGNICVAAGNACNPPTPQICKPVTIHPTPTVTLPDVTICAEDLPYEWPYQPFYMINSPGITTLSGVQYAEMGCDTILTQKIIIKQPIMVNLGQIVVCQGDCFQIGGQSYCQSGQYLSSLTSVNGCDSSVVFNLTVANVGSVAQINAPQGQSINCLTPSVTLNTNPINNTVQIWKNMAGDTLGTGSSITVTEAGFYTLEVKSSIPGANCSGTAKILIKKNTNPPPVTASGGTLDANNPTVQLMGNSILSGMIYHWTGPNGFTSSLKKPIVSVPGFYTLTVTNPQTGCSTSITVEVIQMV
ncbi:MAG TPA: hypothetical protein DCF33_12525 [Saprospirales bacterium]|nr:hypothetical protein [Saprospirales bacterium]